MAFDPQSAFGRLPLIAEYNGICHRDGAAITGRSPLRFEGCNQGRFQSECPHVTAIESRVSRRFTVREHTETNLRLVVLEEVDGVPVRWREVAYRIPEQSIAEENGDEIECAQIRAFCTSYLQLVNQKASQEGSVNACAAGQQNG